MGVPSQLSGCRFPVTTTRHSAHPCCVRVALKGIRLDLKWNAAAQNVSTVTKKKKSDLSGNVSEMPHLSQEEAAEQAGHTRYVWKPHWEGGSDCCFNWKQKQSGCNTRSQVKRWGFFFFFLFKDKGYFKAVLECLSLPEPNSTKNHYVWEHCLLLKCLIGLYLTPPINNHSCQYSFFFFFNAAALKWLRPFLRCLCPKCQVMQNNFTFTD